MNAANAGRFEDRRLNRREVNVPRGSLEQNVDRVQDQPPGPEDDYLATETTAERVCPQKTAGHYQDARDDRRYRAEKIADDMQKRAPHVQIVFMSRMKQESRDDIHDEAA